MHELLDRISNMYRNGLVILDLAPVLVSADASVLAASVGQIVVVVEANRTARASVEQTLSLLQGCKRIALILNKVEASDLVEQYGSYYGEYYVRPDTLAKPSGPQSLADRVISYLRNRLHATKSK